MNYIAEKLDNGKIKLHVRNNNRGLCDYVLTRSEAKELMRELYHALHDDNPIIRTERYCKYFRHVRAQYWCDKGVFPVDCKNCDKADWIEYTITTTNQTTWEKKK